MIEEKKILWALYRLNKSNASYTSYRKLNNKIVATVRQERQAFEANIVKTGPKAFYGYIRRQLSSKVSVPPALRVDDTSDIVTDHSAVANIFAKQFKKSYVQEHDGLFPRILLPRVLNSIESIEFEPYEILKVLRSFKDTTSMGPDEIPTIFLKECATELSEQLSHIMTVSFKSGRLPQDWKEAVVTPIYKKGDKLSASNYRPISLTSIICKTMEKIITEKIRIFLSLENVITEEQHGFVPRRSTVSNLLTCVDKWTSEWNERNSIDVIYLDYEKAFDRVPIKRLIYKLEHFGLRGKLLSWIEDFLSNRKFRVRVGEQQSEAYNVLSGVPQGSVIGPVAFSLFLTDLKAVMELSFTLFADDTKFFGDPIISHQVIQNNLDRTVQWTKDWLLSLNADKCTVLHIGPKNPHLQYSIDGIPLNAVSSQVDLGVTVSNDLKWDNHIIEVVKRANSLLYMIRKSFSCINTDLFLKLYKSYVRPLLEYAYQVWSPYFKKDIDILEKVQRRATKMVLFLRHKSYEDRLDTLGLTTLEKRRQRGDLIETYKILTEHYDVPSLKSMYTKNTNERLRGHSLKLNRNNTTSNPRKHFLSNRVVDTWNKLPEEVISANSVNSFKNKLDKYQKREAINKN